MPRVLGIVLTPVSAYNYILPEDRFQLIYLGKKSIYFSYLSCVFPAFFSALLPRLGIYALHYTPYTQPTIAAILTCELSVLVNSKNPISRSTALISATKNSSSFVTSSDRSSRSVGPAPREILLKFCFKFNRLTNYSKPKVSAHVSIMACSFS